MAMTLSAMWLQTSEEAGTHHLIMIFIGIISIAIAVVAIVGIVVALKAMKSIKEMGAIAHEFKDKLVPLLDEATALTRSGRELLDETGPRLKIITENLVKTTDTLHDTSLACKAAVLNVQGTVTDATTRTQRQIARVDGMITTAINTTAEVIENINEGIRVPAQKIALLANQARFIAEGLFEKIKSMAGAVPFATKKEPRRSAPVPPPSGNQPGSPGSPTGSTGPREPIAVP
jgi:hypothetical protein